MKLETAKINNATQAGGNQQQKTKIKNKASLPEKDKTKR